MFSEELIFSLSVLSSVKDFMKLLDLDCWIAWLPVLRIDDCILIAPDSNRRSRSYALKRLAFDSGYSILGCWLIMTANIIK